MFDGASFVVNGDGSAGGADARLGRAGSRHQLDQDRAGLALRPGRASRAGRPSGGHLLRDGAGPARLCRSQRFPRCRAGPFGRDRQCRLRRDRGRCAGRGPGVVRDAAQPLHQPGEASTMRRPAPRRWAAATRRSRSSRPSTASTRCWRTTSPIREVDLTEENLQSRIRGVTLMALSNKFGPMLVTTGNKSEMSVGYATIYGDMAGGYNPLKDAYKIDGVRRLPQWRNASAPADRPGPAGRRDPRRASSPSRRARNCARTRRTRIRCRPTTCSIAILLGPGRA